MYNHQLDTFIKIADLGSFGKAAEALYISSPAIIQQINLLESRCGFKLFIRSNHGVKLTPAGQSLYEDAKTLIKLSEDAVNKARRLADTSDHTVRIGTSLLFKCRLLPDLWTRVSENIPELKIEIIPMPEHQSRENSISDLGTKYDIREGIYCTISQKGTCGFLELGRTPFCCAVAKNHALANYRQLTLNDLNGEYLVMPIENVSEEMDAFRNEIKEKFPTVHIIDSSYYGVDTFTLCEVNPYILITQKVCEDIHTNLVTIPLETGYTMPYGLMYANNPTTAARKFIDAAGQLKKEKDNFLKQDLSSL